MFMIICENCMSRQVSVLPINDKKASVFCEECKCEEIIEKVEIND